MAAKAVGSERSLVFVDTDVLVEITRENESAVEWSRGVDEELLVPGVVAMEMLIGSRNKGEKERAEKLLSAFNISWHSSADNSLAFDLLRHYGLAAGLSLPDFFIAAQSLNQDAKLYSFNLKHFRAIPNLAVEAPYPRQ
ncbi:MAG TPA: PIN domain-containing protein [Fimbriimonas sp.]|nr:PIN domain-containing protein [Fimbriimonas sp.]